MCVCARVCTKNKQQRKKNGGGGAADAKTPKSGGAPSTRRGIVAIAVCQYGFSPAHRYYIIHQINPTQHDEANDVAAAQSLLSTGEVLLL